MNYIFLIAGGWAIGMFGFIVLDRYGKYNNKHYWDIKDFERKFKKVQEEINGTKKTF